MLRISSPRLCFCVLCIAMDNLSKPLSFASSIDCQPLTPHRPQASWDHKPLAMIMPSHHPWPSNPWPPSIKTPSHDSCRSWDFWDDPSSSILPHKQSPDLHRSQPLASSSLGIDDSGILMACEPRSSVKDDFPFPVVSGSRAIPFACKLDVGASEESDLGFASLSGFSDEESNPSGKTTVSAGGFHVKVEMDESHASVQGPVALEVRGTLQASLENGSNRQGCTELGGRGGKNNDESKVVMVKKELQQQADKHGEGAEKAGDTAIGLKLGKRTYFEDSSTGGGGETTRGTSSAPSNNSNNVSNKKHKASSVTTNVPRCQAEGCSTDLSTAKDYHRRHKVCEWHSKASKVKVGNLEQRFCQQCSRFHVLSEFDEGKRSCRRRLAGHNERRRKQQPDAMPLLSSGSFPFLPDKHLLNSSLLEHHCFLQHQRSAMASSLDQAALACQLRLAGADTQVLKLLRIPKEEPMTSYPSLELHHFMQDTGLMGGHGFQPPGALHIGPEALSSASQTASGMAVSGRALSLLSSSCGSPSIPCSMSLGISSPYVDQLLAENPSRQTMHKTSGSQACFTPVSMGIASTPLGLTNSNGSVSGFSNTVDREQNCDGRSMFIMLQQNEFQGMQGGDSQHGRPILDLMQSPSPQSQGSRAAQMQQPMGIQYADFEGLRSYESMFGRQNIM